MSVSLLGCAFDDRQLFGFHEAPSQAHAIQVAILALLWQILAEGIIFRIPRLAFA